MRKPKLLAYKNPPQVSLVADFYISVKALTLISSLSSWNVSAHPDYKPVRKLQQECP